MDYPTVLGSIIISQTTHAYQICKHRPTTRTKLVDFLAIDTGAREVIIHADPPLPQAPCSSLHLTTIPSAHRTTSPPLPHPPSSDPPSATRQSLSAAHRPSSSRGQMSQAIGAHESIRPNPLSWNRVREDVRKRSAIGVGNIPAS